MKQILLVLALVLVTVFAHEHGHSPHGTNHNFKNSSVCHYRTTKGVDYDLRLLDHQAVSDLQYYDVATGTTFYFRPCGVVTSYQQHGNSCPAGSSVCMVSSSGKAVSFGSSQAIQWADGVEDHASVEAAYGNGETCNNGASRKTFVEYVCNLKKTSASTSIVNVTMIDECTAKFIVEGAFACPVANYCASINNDESCRNQLNMCQWVAGKCEATNGCFLWRHMHASGLVAIVLITCAGVLLACTFGLCVCACRKRRRCIRNGACKRRASSRFVRKNRTARKNTPAKKVVVKDDNVEYAPFQMPFQLIPGGFAPVNPYSNIQGYPMVTLVAPSGEETV